MSRRPRGLRSISWTGWERLYGHGGALRSKPKYDGDLRSRDAAYHQGPVWGWLIGPYVDAWLKAPIHPSLIRVYPTDVDLAPSTASRRCILLFARTAKEEAGAKRLSRARGLFALARRRVLAAARSLPEVDLLVAGPGGTLPQRGGSFAERLENAFADARALGYEEIVAVPTDVPRLGRRQLAEAFRRLAAAPAVLGPSPDGGAYLIGCRNDPAVLFAGVRWQTPRTFADLAANAGSAAVLDPLEDVDRWADLPALAAGPDREIAGLVAVILRGPASAQGFRRPVPILLADPLLLDRPPPPPRLTA